MRNQLNLLVALAPPFPDNDRSALPRWFSQDLYCSTEMLQVRAPRERTASLEEMCVTTGTVNLEAGFAILQIFRRADLRSEVKDTSITSMNQTKWL